MVQVKSAYDVAAIARWEDQGRAAATLGPIIDEWPGPVALALGRCGGDNELRLLECRLASSDEPWPRHAVLLRRSIEAIRSRLATNSLAPTLGCRERTGLEPTLPEVAQG